MWKLSLICNGSGPQLWFSDAEPLDSIRGGNGVSSRLIIDTQGFIDFTELQLPSAIILDLNSALVHSSIPSTIDLDNSSHAWVDITLTIPGDGTFVANANFTGSTTNVASVAGKVKPLPSISASDVAFFDDMITKKYVPFRNIPDAPGKSTEEIKKLGAQFFPFTPYSFQLAMSIYDWTSASFARMVLMKIFQYTGIPQTPLPLDSTSIARAIWTTHVGTYVPSNVDFMNSFLMKPASSEKDVRSQLGLVAPQLHEFSDVQNRLLSAAVQAQGFRCHRLLRAGAQPELPALSGGHLGDRPAERIQRRRYCRTRETQSGARRDRRASRAPADHREPARHLSRAASRAARARGADPARPRGAAASCDYDGRHARFHGLVRPAAGRGGDRAAR